MPLKTRKPTTPGQRGLVLQTTDDITEEKPKKSRGFRKKKDVLATALSGRFSMVASSLRSGMGARSFETALVSVAKTNIPTRDESK